MAVTVWEQIQFHRRSHGCYDSRVFGDGFWVIRKLQDGARVVIWQCGHLELRQRDEPLPDHPLPRSSTPVLRSRPPVYKAKAIRQVQVSSMDFYGKSGYGWLRNGKK